MTDADRTAILGELVRARHIADPEAYRALPLGHRWIVLEEVANGTGAIGYRHADYVAVNLWPSDGLDIIGYEVKASRADLKRELLDPLKAAQSGADWMDEWWLVVWSERHLEGFAVPEPWGILARVTGKHDDEHDFKVLRRAIRRARQRDEAVPRWRVMAMLRSAVRTTPGAWYTSEAVRVAVQRTMRDCEREVRSNTEAEIADWLAPVCKAMGRNPSRNPPSIEELCRYAVEHLAPGA